MRWVDASRSDQAELRKGLDHTTALRRLHPRHADGRPVLGAAAFIEIWKELHAFAGLARIRSHRYGLALLDIAYHCFLLFWRVWSTPAFAECNKDTLSRSS